MSISRWRWKTTKTIILSPVPSYESLGSVKENTDRKRQKTRKKERKKERKNTDRKQTKLKAPHVTYYVKILPQ